MATLPAVNRTLAWPLAFAYTGLIVYASLYPFSQWRDQGLWPLEFLQAPLPRYWTGFDVISNVLGYLPLGFLLGVAWLRSRQQAVSALRVVAIVFLVGTGVSLVLEAVQAYLPARVPSNVDLALNSAGSLAGGVLAVGLERMGVLSRWSRFRQRWFSQDANGALALLVLWPFGLLFPAAVPLSLGQVFERAEAALTQALDETPFLEWLPVREMELQPLVPLAELVCVALGLLVPVLLGYSVITGLARRLLAAAWVLACALGVSALSSALSYGPEHAWAWLSLAAQVGLAAGMVAALAACLLTRRAAASIALLALGIHLTLINQAPTSAYFAQTLHDWEQGRFIRFHGLSQWLGWLWPYLVLAYLLRRVSRRDPP